MWVNAGGLPAHLAGMFSDLKARTWSTAGRREVPVSAEWVQMLPTERELAGLRCCEIQLPLHVIPASLGGCSSVPWYRYGATYVGCTYPVVYFTCGLFYFPKNRWGQRRWRRLVKWYMLKVVQALTLILDSLNSPHSFHPQGSLLILFPLPGNPFPASFPRPGPIISL